LGVESGSAKLFVSSSKAKKNPPHNHNPPPSFLVTKQPPKKVAWECCARRTPYEGMNGVQAAMAVVNRGLRPQIPAHTPPALADLIRACWAAVPEQRPPFDAVCEWVRAIEAGLEAQEAAANAAAANAAAANAVAVKVAASPVPSPPVTLNAAAPSPWPPLSPAPPSMGV
jgi:hypothetical protein